MAERKRYLVVVAVEAEAKAVREGLARSARALSERSPEWVVQVGGTGIAEAAVSTAACILQSGPFSGIFNAGIAGGFYDEAAVPYTPGAVVVGSQSVAAELGVETAECFLEWAELGFGTARYRADCALLEGCKQLLDCRIGTIITVSTVSGTKSRAEQLMLRFPDAVAEAMEGFGVAVAAARFHIPFVELRAISNPVGPRERAAWRIDEALHSLCTAFAQIGEGWPE